MGGKYFLIQLLITWSDYNFRLQGCQNTLVGLRAALPPPPPPMPPGPTWLTRHSSTSRHQHSVTGHTPSPQVPLTEPWSSVTYCLVMCSIYPTHKLYFYSLCSQQPLCIRHYIVLDITILETRLHNYQLLWLQTWDYKEIREAARSHHVYYLFPPIIPIHKSVWSFKGHSIHLPLYLKPNSFLSLSWICVLKFM